MKYEEMMRNVNTAGTWFVGAFMGEFLAKYPEYSTDLARRTAFIRYMHQEYGKNLDYTYETTKTKCYAVMAIINGKRVLDALEHVINSNDKKVPEDAKVNAKCAMDAIESGKLKLP